MNRRPPTPPGKFADVRLQQHAGRRAPRCGVCARPSDATPCVRCECLIESWRGNPLVVRRAPVRFCSSCLKARLPSGYAYKTCQLCRDRANRSANGGTRSKYNAKRRERMARERVAEAL